MSSHQVERSLNDRWIWSFIGGALIALTVVRITLWHFETSLGFTTAPIELLLLGALFGFTIPWMVVSGTGCLIGQLSDRNPTFPRHMALYLQASLWLTVYHVLALWVRTVTEFRIPIWIGWIAQPLLYTILTLHYLRRR